MARLCWLQLYIYHILDKLVDKLNAVIRLHMQVDTVFSSLPQTVQGCVLSPFMHFWLMQTHPQL